MVKELNFRSDNESPAAPEIMEAIVAANSGSAWSYGEDDYSQSLNQKFSELFETDTFVLPLSTGTAANSIALASATPPWGAVFCHQHAHVIEHECGAPEFFGGGLRLIGLSGEQGKIDPVGFSDKLTAMHSGGIHSYQAAALSLTQSTESGSVYQQDQIMALTGVAREEALAIHMDGARFANAVASLACAPADISWRAGIDMLSFGASKNGCFGAEALLFFNRPDLYDTALRLRKRSGHLLSKMRFVSAQLQAYVDDDLWLNYAQRANDKAAEFARLIDKHSELELAMPVETNQVFVNFNREHLEPLQQSGVRAFPWPGPGHLMRFVFSCTDTDEDCGKLGAIIEQL
jgi:threonine aldolase